MSIPSSAPPPVSSSMSLLYLLQNKTAIQGEPFFGETCVAKCRRNVESFGLGVHNLLIDNFAR